MPTQGDQRPKLAWMKFYVDDWLSSSRVTLMSDAEERAYFRLLLWQWKTGSVPNETGQLARILGRTEDETAELWKCIADLFPEGKNPKCARVFEEQAAFNESRRENARKGWQARRDASASASASATGDATDHATEMKSQVSGLRSQEPGPRTQKKTARKRAASAKPRPDSVHHQFIAWWCETWEEVRGVKYAVSAKDGAAVKGIRKAAEEDLAEMQRRAEVMLSLPDAWTQQNASLSLLLSHWNQFAGKVNQRAIRAAKQREGRMAWLNEVEIVPDGET